MALSFEFPGWQVSMDAGSKQHAPPANAAAAWAADLDELSGSEDAEQEDTDSASAAASRPWKRQRTETAAGDGSGQHSPQQEQGSATHPAAAATVCSDADVPGWGVMPDAVLLLLVARLGVAGVAAAAAVCSGWLAAITAADDIWQQQQSQLLGAGWPWAPFASSRLTPLPASLAGTAGRRRQLRATLSLNKVSLRFQCMRKGFEFLVEGFEALWVHLAEPRQQQQQLDDRFSGRHLQKLVHKLSNHSWQLMYEGFAAALTARTDHIRQLLAAWQQRQSAAAAASSAAAATLEGLQQQQEAGRPAGATGSGHSQPAISLSAAADIAAAAAAAAAAATTAALADCAGGILSAVEATAGGAFSGELLSAEPELLLAATHRGVRPAAAIALWQQLLAQWALFDKWLHMLVTRCSLLGARVAAARQLMEPTGSSSVAPSVIPHLRNKGLLVFRSQVLLSYGLRRPLQQAALWLSAAAAAAADSSTLAWHGSSPAATSSGCHGTTSSQQGGRSSNSGGGGSSREADWLSETDFEVLLAARKLLRELDVPDDGSEGAATHTHAKFRRCFGALLTRERRNRSCMLR